MAKNDESSETEPEQMPTTSDRQDISKLVGGEDGEGFNQFDTVLSATGFNEAGIVLKRHVFGAA